MTSLLHTKNSFKPRYDLVRRRVCGLVQVDDAITQVLTKRTTQGSITALKRRIVTCSNLRNPSVPHVASENMNNHYHHLIVVFQKKWPFRSVECGSAQLRFQYELGIHGAAIQLLKTSETHGNDPCDACTIVALLLSCRRRKRLETFGEVRTQRRMDWSRQRRDARAWPSPTFRGAKSRADVTF